MQRWELLVNALLSADWAPLIIWKVLLSSDSAGSTQYPAAATMFAGLWLVGCQETNQALEVFVRVAAFIDKPIDDCTFFLLSVSKCALELSAIVYVLISSHFKFLDNNKTSATLKIIDSDKLNR